MAKKTKNSNLSIEERLEQALIPNWDQPYKLPENWCWVKVDTVATIYTGNSINERVKEEKYTGITDGFVYLATKDIDFDSTINYETNVCIPQSDGFKVAPKYSTLLCIEGGSAGRKIGYITQDVCFVNKLCAFVPHAKINPKYLYYVIQSDAFKKQFDAKKHGLIGGVSVKEVSSIFIPFAPIEIQNKVVKLIESVFNKLDEATEKAQEVVDGFETRKAAILHKAFLGELTAKWRKENNISFEDWENRPLSQIATVVSGFAFSSSDFNPQNTVPCIKITNVGVGEYLSDEYEFLPEAYLNGYEKFIVNKGDILISLTRSYINAGLKVCISEETKPSLLNQRVAMIKNCNIRYIYYFLRSDKVLSYVKEKSKTTNQPNLSIKDLNNLMVPIAGSDEQLEIVKLLDYFVAKEQQAKETAEAVIEQIDTMKKAILARAFRGELGTNNPSEESAVELLKQVLNTVSEPKKSIKRTTIPKALDNRIKTDLEHKIIKLYFQNEVDVLSIDLIMGVSSKKFEIMEALRDLQQRGLIEKQNDKYKLLG